MKILIVAPFCSLPNEPHFNRFLYLAKILSENHAVTLVTSRFRHFDKAIRQEFNTNNKNLSIVLIDEPGYSKNVSISRIYSHSVFLKNFKSWFESSFIKEKFDVIYSAFPLIGTNIYLGKRKKKLNYKLIIDVQDVWPESFSAVIPFLSKIPANWVPLSSLANKAYRSADGLIAVSKGYLDRAMLVNKSAPGKVVYIGADAENIKSIPPKIFNENFFDLCYIGTLSYSYDMETVIHGINEIAKQDTKIRLHILGDGPELNHLKSIASDNVIFYGFLPYKEMISIAKGCDALINPIKSNSRASITNKLSDYIALSKPIINCQSNLEVLKILSQTKCVNYLSGNTNSFKNAVFSIRSMNFMSSTNPNNDLIRKFDRSISYQSLIDFIEKLSTDTNK